MGIAAVAHTNTLRHTYHRAGPSYRGETAFSPPVVPHHPQPFSVASKGATATRPYPDLAGACALYTRSFTPGKFLAKVSSGELSGVKTYLAERGDINVQLDEGELAVLQREVGGDCRGGNPAFSGAVGDVEIGDTALHV